jgi:hypothetical protein
MSQIEEKTASVYCEIYPKGVIIFRWIILALAFALGIYILADILPMLGMIYAVCSLFALTLILPLSRCVYCHYHGKLCNTGWGKIAAYLYAKGDESLYVERYNYAILLHLLWIVPLLAFFFQLIRNKELRYLVVLLIYLIILWMEKVVLKKLACRRCHQREFCPALPFRKTKV